MSDSSLKHPVQVLTAKDLHRLFKFRVQGLSLSKRAEFNGEPPTLSSVSTALWHWFSRLNPEEAEAFLEGEFVRLQAFMRGEKGPPPEAGRPEGAAGTKLKRPPR